VAGTQPLSDGSGESMICASGSVRASLASQGRQFLARKVSKIIARSESRRATVKRACTSPLSAL